MRLAKTWITVWQLALVAVLAPCAIAQEHPNVQPSAVRDQLKPAEAPPSAQQQPAKAAPAKTAPAPAAPPKTPSTTAAKTPVQAPAKANAPANANPPVKASAPAKSAAQATKAAPSKPAAKPPAKAAAQTLPKTPAKAASQTPTKPPAEKPSSTKATAPKRDPFESLLMRASAVNAPPENLPPGRAGLVVSTLSIDGVVRAPSGMIAVVSNPQHRVYFLREGDKLYDGSVDHITLEAVSFHEIGKDAFGKPVERAVTKRLYATSGEQP
jgi:Tfp pilus assembly protein PilP